MKLDRQESQYSPTVYQNRGRGYPQRQGNYEYRNRLQVIGPTIGIEVDQGIMGMDIAIGEAIMSKNYRRNNYRQDYGNQGYRNRNRSLSQDHGRSRQRYRSNSGDNFRNRSYDRSQSRNREREVEIEKERLETETDPVVERKDKG